MLGPAPMAGMTPALLRTILAYTQQCFSQDQLGMYQLYLRDAVAMLLEFYGLLRRSNIISMKLSDVTIIEEFSVRCYIKPRIRKSKNDQAG